MWNHHLTHVVGKDGIVYYRNEWGPDSKPVIVRKPNMSLVEIPPITDPLGKHWSQPRRDEVLVDHEVAMMTERTLNKLPEYSCSIPSGTYQGKMWKCLSHGKWYLRWYVNDPNDASMLLIPTRLIVLIILLLLVTPCQAQQRRIIVGEPIYIGTPYFPYPPVYYAWPRGRSSWQHQRYAARRELYRAKNAKLNAKDTPRR